jgi:hypothetical protein
VTVNHLDYAAARALGILRAMQFTKRLREGIRTGEITCSIRIWAGPRVKAGNRYRMDPGQVEVDSIAEIALSDITPKLARESGFDGVVDLLKTAKHGSGENVYLVRFHYVPPAKAAARQRPAKTKQKPSSARQRKRVLQLLERLPEAVAVAKGTHLLIQARKKPFGYFLDDHHGDGRVALNCKSTPDVRDMLQDAVPAQFHVPKYVGNKGWIGLWLDVPDVDWSAVELALREAYALALPRTPRSRKAR